MKNLISVSGKKGSGKNLVAAIITDLTYDQVHWEVKSFADKLKYITCSLIGCTREQLEDREFKEKELGEEWWYVKLDNKLISVQEYIDYIKGTTYSFNEKDIIKLTPRKLLQLLGTECGRQIIHPNIWVNALFADYKTFGETKQYSNSTPKDNDYPNWIITDVRFPNELEAIKKHNGLTIRINRDSVLRTGKVFDTDNHESETALDDYQGFDYVIDNNGTIEELKEVVKDILIKEHLI